MSGKSCCNQTKMDLVANSIQRALTCKCVVKANEKKVKEQTSDSGTTWIYKPSTFICFLFSGTNRGHYQIDNHDTTPANWRIISPFVEQAKQHSK